MWINTPGARLALSERRALRLGDARGTRLRAVSGSVWITIDHDPRDIVLDTGDDFVIETRSGLVILPLGERATIDVCSDAATPQPARAIVGALRRPGNTTPWHRRVEAWLHDRLAPRP